MSARISKFVGAIGIGIIAFTFLYAAFAYGQSKLPKSDLCEANYRLDGTWEPVGWKIENGFPRTDCRLPADRVTFEDGTWIWK